MAESPEERRLRDHRRALSNCPSYKLDIPWREHLSAFKVWSLLFGVQDVEFKKASLFYSIKTPAPERVRTYGAGTPEFTNAANFEEYAKLLGETSEPVQESQLCKAEFYSYKQGRHQDINAYLSMKIALYRQGFGTEAESTQFDSLLTEII